MNMDPSHNPLAVPVMPGEEFTELSAEHKLYDNNNIVVVKDIHAENHTANWWSE